MIFVSVHALLLDGAGRVFMMRRTNQCRDEHGRWDVIFGGLDEGETAEAAIRREIAEETTARPVKLEFAGYHDLFRAAGAGAHPHTVGLDFAAWVSQEDIRDVRVREHGKFGASGWFRADELPAPLHTQIPTLLQKYPHLWRPR